MVKMEATKEESVLIGLICKRAVKICKEYRTDYPYESQLAQRMDIEAVHCNGMPLDLKQFLTSEDRDFAHDCGGILKHIDRETGKLGNCFVPRCAKEILMNAKHYKVSEAGITIAMALCAEAGLDTMGSVDRFASADNILWDDNDSHPWKDDLTENDALNAAGTGDVAAIVYLRHAYSLPVLS